MRFARTHLSLGLAFGLTAGLTGSSSLRADEPVHTDGHDHAAMAEKKITETLAKLSPEDRKAVDAQRFCPVMEYGRLGAMGAPIKLVMEGKPVFLCCKGCVKKAEANPAATLAKVDALKKAGMAEEHDADHVHAEQKK